ncbi:hypothetical protein OAO01_02985, partial [Oligoflexia bacterium]|nr:hypothetical protein [Oligoflexia bacterium]
MHPKLTLVSDAFEVGTPTKINSYCKGLLLGVPNPRMGTSPPPRIRIESVFFHNFAQSRKLFFDIHDSLYV